MEDRYKCTVYCTPRVNVPYERHTFHRIGTNCAFDVITTDEIYRDHLVVRKDTRPSVQSGVRNVEPVKD